MGPVRRRRLQAQTLSKDGKSGRHLKPRVRFGVEINPEAHLLQAMDGYFMDGSLLAEINHGLEIDPFVAEPIGRGLSRTQDPVRERVRAEAGVLRVGLG